jgi:hypothetical protein
LVIALITGLTFLNLGTSAADLQYRVFVIFIATVVPALILAQVEPTYILARNIFIREDSLKMYSPWIFSLGQLLAEMPNLLLCAVVFFLLLTYPAGFQMSSSHAGYQFLIILVTEIFSVTLGQAIAALLPSIFIAALSMPKTKTRVDHWPVSIQPAVQIAVHEQSVAIIVDNPYPSPEEETAMVQASWRRAYKTMKLPKELRALPRDLHQFVRELPCLHGIHH